MAGAMPQQQQQQQQQAIGSTLYPDAHVLNSYRIAAVAERLAMYIQAGHQTEASEVFNLCLSLSRGIDYAVANGEVPSKAHELPSLLKQVYQRKEDFLLQAAIMVLMISVKTACKSGWFPAKDADDLLTLTNELRSCYCSTEYIHAEPSNDLPTISKIFARFYPGMKLGHLLVSLEIKPGYGAFVSDFNIPKKAMCAQEQNIFLFVAQIDNTETSSCIISPPLVNFLLNGKGVQKRINVSMENGPQFPTNVSPMLRYGTNLLQAVGQFNGNYIMAVVSLSVASSLDTPVLHDHDGPLVASHDSDSEIIEGPSRISLNCPISMSPIKIPVKGHRCKHHQCFDYDNFIKMNLRRPSWRCPHCNQSVTYMDIRIDQFMVKVLREVGETGGDVIISADGSWKPVMQSGECTDSRWCQLDLLEQNKDSPANVVDLTMEGMECSDAMNTWETEDRKPFQDTVQGYPVVGSGSMDVPLEMNNTSLVVQDAASRSVDSFWSRLLQSCSSFETASAGPRSDAHLASILSESPPMNSVSASVPSDPIAWGTCGTTQPSNVHPGQLVAPTSSQLQASQFGNSILNCDVRRPAIPRNISRTPIAIQALAVPNVPNPHQQPRSNLNSLISNRTPPLVSQTLPSISPTDLNTCSVGGSNMETQQFAWSAVNSFPHVASTSMQSHLVTQNWNHQHNLHIRMQSQQQVVGLAATSQVSGAYRGSSRTQPVHHNPHHQQVPNLGVPQYMTQRTNLVQPSNHFSLSQVQRGLQGAGCQTSGSTTSTNANSRIATSAQRATNMAGTLPVEPVQLQAPRTGTLPVTLTGEHRGNMGGTVQQVSRTHDLIELPSEQNWRPPVQMRGSLTGRAISPSISQFIIQPTEMAQFPGPPSDLTSHDLIELPSEQNWRPPVRMRGSLTGRAISPSISQFIIQPTEMAQFPRPPSDLTSQAAVFLPPRLQDNSIRSANGSQS